MHWKEKKSQENILMHSEAKDFSLAKEEWEDALNGLPCSPDCICDICKTTGLHHKFEIKNMKTNSRLWVGSNCIAKFDVVVYDIAGKRITDKNEINRQFDLRKREIDRAVCLEVLRDLWRSGLTQEEKQLVKTVGIPMSEERGVDVFAVERVLSLLRLRNIAFDKGRFNNARKGKY